MDHNIYFTDSFVLFVVFGWHVKFSGIRWVTAPYCVGFCLLLSQIPQTYDIIVAL